MNDIKVDIQLVIVYPTDGTTWEEGHERIQYDMPMKCINRLRILSDALQEHIAKKYYGGNRIWG